MLSICKCDANVIITLITTFGVHPLQLIHFNSAEKEFVAKENIKWFRSMLEFYNDLDGYLMRREILHCNSMPDTQTDENTEVKALTSQRNMYISFTFQNLC